jgi:hypothetical protein
MKIEIKKREIRENIHIDTEQTMNQCLIKGIGGIIKNS